MRKIIKTSIILLITAFIFNLLFTDISFAHPGNTARDGCHYCRTNCSKWGVPWYKRHCHRKTKKKYKSEKIDTKKLGFIFHPVLYKV